MSISILPSRGPGFLLLCLLFQAVISAQIIADGEKLTVTTENAEVVFQGPNLIGFTNRLTGDSYANGTASPPLANLERTGAAGQALHSAGWSITNPSGTAGAVATLLASDSNRTLTLAVSVDPASQEVLVRISGRSTTPGIRNASWGIAGLDLAAGRWIVPGQAGVVFDRHSRLTALQLAYPFSWECQMAVYEGGGGSMVLYANDTLSHFKQMRLARRENTLDVSLLTEALAPWPAATTVPEVEWRLKAFAGDWKVAATAYRNWLATNRAPLPDGPRAWARDIRAVVLLNTIDQALVTRLAGLLTPSKTLLYVPHWRQAEFDRNYPDYTPRPGVASLVAHAHNLGFKVMLHVNYLGVSPSNPAYQELRQFQVKDPEFLTPQGWQWERPASTPTRFAYISPASSAFRRLLINRIGAAVSAVQPDAIHLDQSLLGLNDGNGLIEGMTFQQGTTQLHRELTAAFPNLAFGGEGMTDLIYSFNAFAQS